MEREEVVLQDTFEEEWETRMMWLYDYTRGHWLFIVTTIQEFEK